MKKRIVAMMLSLAMLSAMTIFGMTACGVKKAGPASSAPASGASKPAEASAPSAPAPEASAPSAPAPEASVPASQASGEQPKGGNGAGSLEALLEKWTVKDLEPDFIDRQFGLVGGIRDGQEYQGYLDAGELKGDELFQKIFGASDEITMIQIDSTNKVVNFDRGRGNPNGYTVNSYQTHPDNDKFLEMMGDVSYTLIPASPLDPKWEKEAIIFFRTDGGLDDVKFFMPFD